MNNNFTMLQKYASDLTSETYITNPAIAREKELKELMLVLLTPEKSAILVGKPGIGKSAIVEGLAFYMQRKMVPNALLGYRIIKVSTSSLMGNNDGENKVMKLCQELKQLGNVILFIDEIHTLIGTNNGEGTIDIANMLKEDLSRGNIKMIGATTTDEYNRYILRDKAFLRRFEKVEVEEPTPSMCVQILLQTLPKIEKQTGIVLPYTDFQKENIMKFIVNMTTEFKRIYEVSSRYPDIALVMLRQAFSNALFENRKAVCFKNIYDAIRFSKAVYPDVIKKELVTFKEVFKDELMKEQVFVDPNNHLHN